MTSKFKLIHVYSVDSLADKDIKMICLNCHASLGHKQKRRCRRFWTEEDFICSCSSPKESILFGENTFRIFPFRDPESIFVFVNTDRYPNVKKIDIQCLVDRHFTIVTDQSEHSSEDSEFVGFEDDFGYLCDVPSSEDDLQADSVRTTSSTAILDDVEGVVDDSSSSRLRSSQESQLIFDQEVTFEDIHENLYRDQSKFQAMMISKVIKREISESLYTEISRSLKEELSRTHSRSQPDYAERECELIKGSLLLPSIRTLKAKLHSLITPISKIIEDDVVLPKIRGEDPVTFRLKYRWYTIYKHPLLRLIIEYLPLLSHISPYQRLIETANPSSYQLYKEALVKIREKFRVEDSMINEFPSFDTIEEYVTYCESNDIPPIIICPILIFMDGVATAKLGRSAISLVISLATISAEERQRNRSWQHICLVSEERALPATISVLNTLIADIKDLQSGVRVLLPSGKKIILVGYLFRIIGDSKQIKTNLCCHSAYFPCPWCLETGERLLLPSLSSDVLQRTCESLGRIETAGFVLKPETPNIPLFYHSLYAEKPLLIPDPFRLHAGDVLHILYIGLCSDMIKLLEKVLTKQQGTIFNERMMKLGLRTRLGNGLRDGNDSKLVQHYSSLCIFELDKYPPQRRTHTFSFLYDREVAYEAVESDLDTHINVRMPKISTIDDHRKLSFSHIVLLSAIANQFIHEAQVASTDSDCEKVIENYKIFLDILSPLCAKCDIFSTSAPIRKIKTHLLLHIKEWVRDGGSLYNYSAEAGERMNSSVFRLYRYIRTQSTSHMIGSLSLPFLLPDSDSTEAASIRFQRGKCYFFATEELDDSVIMVSSLCEDRNYVRGSIYTYHSPASIGHGVKQFNLFYIYSFSRLGIVCVSNINRLVHCSFAKDLKYTSIPGHYLIAPLRK
ncbi:hypothetical protein ADUPG1_008548 [Aduncisulcus paluster]|uniref:Uncharacterized protein n=1 Tax=Aduncisulcus paluster TaxID=2918883 RepID=A0ABQ5KSD6_9EUKA|nr:hypothetical protein ADUPG1_008548 [Aduncisulcus paluster]